MAGSIPHTYIHTYVHTYILLFLTPTCSTCTYRLGVHNEDRLKVRQLAFLREEDGLVSEEALGEKEETG